MLNHQTANDQSVLVELSVIPLGNNGQVRDRVADVLSIVDETGLFHERTRSGTCIEGKWSDISPVIYACYERVLGQSPQGFLKVSIR
jgi:uncharacterized protein YqgV (UPF0045/DUF77 family)